MSPIMSFSYISTFSWDLIEFSNSFVLTEAEINSLFKNVREQNSNTVIILMVSLFCLFVFVLSLKKLAEDANLHISVKSVWTITIRLLANITFSKFRTQSLIKVLIVHSCCGGGGMRWGSQTFLTTAQKQGKR